MDADDLDDRLRAVERALTGDDTALPDLEDGAAVARRLDAVEERLDSAVERLDDLDAATQALRGYVGNVRSVNRDVERRADLALSRAERIEARFDGEGETGPGRLAGSAARRETTDGESWRVRRGDGGPASDGTARTAGDGRPTDDGTVLDRLVEWL